jgi:uncharacterized protein (DUF2132 family)
MRLSPDTGKLKNNSLKKSLKILDRDAWEQGKGQRIYILRSNVATFQKAAKMVLQRVLCRKAKMLATRQTPAELIHGMIRREMARAKG